MTTNEHPSMQIDLENVHPAFITAYQAVMNWAGDIATKQGVPRWLTLFGGTHNGKTLLADLALRTVALGGRRARLYTFRELFKGFLTNEDRLYFIDRKFRRPRVLIIDDLWASADKYDRRKAIVEDMLYDLMEERIAHPMADKPHRWMLLTTSMTPQQIAERTSPRIADRLYRDGNEVIDMRAIPPYNRSIR